MVKGSELVKKVYKPKEIAEMLGVTYKTLQNWDAAGKVKFRRTPESNYRYLSRQDMIDLLVLRGLYYDDEFGVKRDIIYARVSSHEQKAKGDLDRQVTYLIEAVPDLQNPLVLSEVGSGLSDKRKKVQKLIELVLNDKVNRIFITYKDRLTRFGYNYLETICTAKGVDIVVVKQLSEEKTVEMEFAEDLMNLVASFSGKLYGMRSGKGNKKSGK